MNYNEVLLKNLQLLYDQYNTFVDNENLKRIKGIHKLQIPNGPISDLELESLIDKTENTLQTLETDYERLDVANFFDIIKYVINAQKFSHSTGLLYRKQRRLTGKLSKFISPDNIEVSIVSEATFLHKFYDDAYRIKHVRYIIDQVYKKAKDVGDITKENFENKISDFNYIIKPNMILVGPCGLNLLRSYDLTGDVQEDNNYISYIGDIICNNRLIKLCLNKTTYYNDTSIMFYYIDDINKPSLDAGAFYLYYKNRYEIKVYDDYYYKGNLV
jgi:hypothetical protein